MRDNKINFDIVKRAKDLFFSICPNSYGVLLFSYLYRINALKIIQNADYNTPNVMFTIDRALLQVISSETHQMCRPEKSLQVLIQK